MNLDNQKWYDKPVTKIILITISLTWMIPYVGFVLSSFRNEQAVKRYAVSYTHLTLPTKCSV